MNMYRACTRPAVVLASLMLSVLPATQAVAHCDTMSGPVVQDAQRALEQKDVTATLKWVPQENEEEIRSTFQTALAVRAESEQARQLADRHFFETLVRLHRAGEGEPFTGLKPAGTVDPAIDAADHALADGNVTPLADKIASAVREEINRRFSEAYEKRQAADNSVEQGRDYVDAYVRLTHFVEGIEHIVSEGADHLVQHGANQRAPH